MPRLTSVLRATLVLILGVGLWLPCGHGQTPASRSPSPQDPASFGFHSGRWRAVGSGGPTLDSKAGQRPARPPVESVTRPPVSVAPSSAFVSPPAPRTPREPIVLTSWEQPAATRPSETPAEFPRQGPETSRPAALPPPAELLKATRPKETAVTPPPATNVEGMRPAPAPPPAELPSATRPNETLVTPPPAMNTEAMRPAVVPSPAEMLKATRPNESSPVTQKTAATRPIPPPSELSQARPSPLPQSTSRERPGETRPPIIHKPEPPPIARVPKPEDLVRPVAREFKAAAPAVAASTPSEMIQSLPRETPHVEVKPAVTKVEPRHRTPVPQPAASTSVVSQPAVQPSPSANPIRNVVHRTQTTSPYAAPAPANPIRTVSHRPEPTAPNVTAAPATPIHNPAHRTETASPSAASAPAVPVNPIRAVTHRPAPPPAAPVTSNVIVVPAASAGPAMQEPPERRVLYRVETNARPDGGASFLDPFRSNAETGPSQVVDPFRSQQSAPVGPPLSEREVQPFSVPSQDRQPAPRRGLRGLFSPRE